MQIDPGILIGCKQGKEKSYYALFKHYYSYMLSICLRYTGDEEKAKSELNAGFTKAVLNIQSYDDSLPFKYWLRRILINSIIDGLRKERKYREHINNFYDKIKSIGWHGKANNFGEENLYFEDVVATLDYLPSATRDVFNLFAIDGYSHKEIGEILKISVGTSKWHVSHARKILQERFNNDQAQLNIRYSSASAKKAQ